MIEKDPQARIKHRIDTATEVRLHITETLASRTRPRGSISAHVEDRLKRAGAGAWSMMTKRPLVGVALASGVGLALASAIGVGEITFTLAVGYAVYQVLREGMAPAKAEAEIISVLTH